MTTENSIRKAFELAAERYAAVGVDVNAALENMKKISLSLHCWQADDVSGFETRRRPDRRNSGNRELSGSCAYDRRIAGGH
jgi:L-rhamnose isomerase